MATRSRLAAALLLTFVACVAQAADLGVTGSRLVIKDTLAANARASIILLSRDDAGIQKGPSGLTTNLEGTFEVFYTDDPCKLAKFVLSPGSAWRTNTASAARYVNRDAPTGGTVKRATVRNGKHLRVQAQALGDDSSWTIDMAASGAPSAAGGITTIVTIRNGNDASTHRMCTRFAVGDGSTVRFQTTRDGMGHKLVATGGVPVSCERLSSFRMEPRLARGFFAAPWPNDIRLAGDGSLDMTGYPIPAGNMIAQTILNRGSAVTRGFGTNSAVFFQSCAPIDTATLPSPESSVLPDSAVMLVNLDNPAAPRTPLLLDLKTTPALLRPPDLLSVLAYPGHPLAGQTHYAAILFAGIRTPQGAALSPAPLLAELDDPWDSSKPVDATKWAALKAQRDAVYDYVNQHASWTSADVIAFTVFTTQDVASELQAIAAAVNALPTPTPVSRGTGNCSGGAQRTTVTGQLHLPRWQAGVFPYLYDGGDIVIVGGQAVQQSTETAGFEMTFPCGPAPVNGWPILLFMDGTGAGPNANQISYMGGASSTNPLPYVVASIAPLYSGDRYVAGLPAPFDQSEFLFFNYFNALAGRTNQLQQAADMMYLRRVVEGIQLSAAETGNAAPVPTDDSIEMVAGHSQGALTVPHVLAADSAFDAGFISAGGGGLYETVLHRGDVRSLLLPVIGPGSNELDMFHPLVHVLQTFAEVGDAANYAPRVQNAHLLSTSGLIDGCSPVEVASILGTALGLEIANPLHYPVFGSTTLEPPTTTLPVTGNLSGGRTGVTVQLDTGHFGTVTNPDLGRSFADSLATGAVPTVNANPLLSDTVEGCPRYDPLP